ncbi:hypothetical protein [Cohnella kolymensis]|uniref:hypothetical protein n=1 Tax=Cohnella kolymensis TaxID=1590652 RepID=UPI000698F3FE|nr:hypothetical protein [Cohnella kolymensis]
MGMYRKASIVALAVALQAGAATAAYAAKPSAPAAQSKSAQAAMVYNKFEQSLKNPAKLAYTIQYLNNHIHEVTAGQATLMVLHLETAQTRAFFQLQSEMIKPAVQKVIVPAAGKKGTTFTALLSVIKDNKVRNLLMKARDAGLKVVTSEGMYYLELNYGIYRKYQPFVAKDISDYVGVMMIERDRPSARDGALIIGWTELAERTAKQLDFLDNYKGSNRKREISGLYEGNKLKMFYGLNNTPLFDPVTKEINPNARTAYNTLLAANAGSSNKLIVKLQAFMNLVEKSDGKRTIEINEFLKTQVPVSNGN